MNRISHFRVLYPQFLFRLMDVELLSTSAGGDANVLLGQFGSLLVFGSVLLSWGSLPVAGEARRAASVGPAWSAERFMISLTMLVVAVFALLNWDSTFPDKRDVLVLAPLPVSGQTLFVAKIAAAASALGLTVVALNCIAGFAWPLALVPGGTGLIGTVRFVAAFWATLLAAGTFVYCIVLGMQALAAQLPRRWYLRVSPLLQISAFVLFLSITFFQPSWNTATALAAPRNQRALAWLPSYWFMGFLNQLGGTFAAEGHAVMAPLARRAIADLSMAILLAGGAFLLSYVRTLRKIVEEPDVAPGRRGGVWLPRFGSLPQTALTQFVIRTVLRSRQHRTLLACYLGGGFAIAAIYLEGTRAWMHLPWLDLLRRVNVLLLAVSALTLCAAWLGTRTAFSVPLDLRANWIFRVTPAPAGARRLAAVRRALLAVAVFPVLAATAALLLPFWPSIRAGQHLLVLGLLGSLLTDISLMGFRKIPFTCSYLPGKSKAHMFFWFGIIPLVIAIHQSADLEQHALESPLRYGMIIVTLATASFAAWMIANWTADRSGLTIQFEEVPSDELLGLGLNA